MHRADPDRNVTASVRDSDTNLAEDPRRSDARITVALTEREVRAIIRATTLVADVLRPELMRETGSSPESPLITACQVLTAACERHGIELELGRHGSTLD